MAVRKPTKLGDWHYDFMLQGNRYRGRAAGARTKEQALLVEARVRNGLFENGTLEIRPASYRERCKSGFLYAVQMMIPDVAAGPIKIGFSTEPKNRIRGHNTCGPYPVEIIGTWPAPKGRKDERAVHERFAEHRLVGEWFAPSAELLDFIAQANVASQGVSQEQKQPRALAAAK